MGKFKDAMTRDLRLRNLSPATIEAYLRGARGLVALDRRPPDTLTREEILRHAAPLGALTGLRPHPVDGDVHRSALVPRAEMAQGLVAMSRGPERFVGSDRPRSERPPRSQARRRPIVLISRVTWTSSSFTRTGAASRSRRRVRGPTGLTALGR